MKPISLDKSILPLVAILALVAGLFVMVGLSLRANAVEEAVKTDRILNIAFIVEQGGKPASTELFLFYPATGKGALLDVPGETGLIIKSVNRVDRIDSVYAPRRARAYVEELAGLLDTEIPWWLVLDEAGLEKAVDLLEGLEIFIPRTVELAGPPRVMLPQGAVLLDGMKAVQYASWAEAEEDETELTGRRQKLFQSFVRRVGAKSDWLARADVFPRFRSAFDSNLPDDAFRRLLGELGKLDADRLLMQRVAGTSRTVDGKRLVFPHYDGELVRDIVKQTLNALSSSATQAADKIFTVEILNGTPNKGLAKRTGDIFQSFGYDVISVGNADRDDYRTTRIVDNYANPEALRNVAEVIRCRETLQEGGIPTEGLVADFTITLGADFNGRYCSGQ
jgi:anionic cell wall polymer biosynthesis LytR-Cps2A-Psr (LCP) family protein